ncbi:MAG: peptide chain release factor 2 [Clostridia bacterium]|nr:peptide chain release factor 2 [Clostridia bacterium]
MLQFEELRLQLSELEKPISDLKNALNITKLEDENNKLSEIQKQDNFWDDPENAQKIVKKMSEIKSKITAYEKLVSNFWETIDLIDIADQEGDLSVLDDIKNDITNIENDFNKQRLQALLTGEYDENNAILTFHSGAGGVEAQDWVEMLFRMYSHWAEKHKFKVKTLDFLDGEKAGLKSITVLVSGLNAYGYLKGEMGVHRLVRISPFDASGRRHTSFASLEVMPQIEDDVDIEISPDDIKMDVFHASGAGGQHVNKTSSAVRLTHIPTGIVVACQNERSQFQNKATALNMLKSKLMEIKEREHLEKIEDIKGVQKEITWGSQIRSYVFMPYTLVKDHRTNFEIGNVNAVMDGDLDGFINAYLIWKTKN